MPYFDTTYTSGVIAAREKRLLKDKILRLCELSADEAFRFLIESGFGGGAETTTSVYEYENLITAEERALDQFICEYAPSNAEKLYLLSPRDFHNAKALVKASYLGVDASRLLAPQGFISLAELSACVESKNFKPIQDKCPDLAKVCDQAVAVLEEDPSGAKVGEIFENALYAFLFKAVKGKKILKDLLIAKADMTNILTALRCGDKETAKGKYIPVGSLNGQLLDGLFLDDKDTAIAAFANTPYKDFVALCFADREKGLPMKAAEKVVGGYQTEYFAKRKFELVKNQPFLYYVYRRRTENANVRIVFACLLAGQTEREIKARLRAI